MSAADIEATVLEILGDALDESVASLRENPVLAAHEWDSIASLLALSHLERRFGITLDLRAYHAARTVADLVNLVLGHSPQAHPAQEAQGAPR